MIKNFSFTPTSNYRKINSNFNIQLYTKLTKRQIEFGTPRLTKKNNRFISFRESQTGIDPYFKYINFIQKDIIKPMERPSLYEQFDIKSPNYKHISLYNTKKNKGTKWAIRTVARAPDEEKLPKKQQFKIYYFPPEYNNKEPKKYKSFSLKTDHIGIKIPKINKINSEKSFLKMKAGYTSNSETKTENQWIPRISENSNNNTSSKNYDIINFKPLKDNRYSNCKFLNKSLNFRKKGIGEFCDLANVFNKNFNKEFLMRFEESPKRFYKYNGAFTNMYDVSIRNGKITLPFNLNKN